MKNRILPFCFLAFFLGFSLLLFQTVGVAGHPGDGSSLTGPLNLTWSPLGPDNVSGRTRAVLFDSRDASGNTIYAASVSGGIYKSTNLGLTWNALSSASGDVQKVTCMVQAPNGTIYAGTGENFCVPTFSGLKDFNYTTAFIGNGLWYSDDGVLFQPMNGTQPTAGTITGDWAFVNKLAVDPRNGRLFAATNTGLKYMDPGSGWNTAMAGYTKEVEVGSDGTILAEINDSCYIADGGNINGFINLSNGSATGLPAFDVGSVEFAIAPSDENVIYASVTIKSNGFLMNAYVSQDKGKTWSIIFPGNTSFDPYGGEGCYATALIVNPNDANQILLGGQNMWLGTKYQPTGYYSWDEISNGFSPLFSRYIPVSHHSYLFGPDKTTLLVASDKGVTVGTYPNGLETGNRNLKTSQFYSVGFTYSKNIVIGGAQNNGTQLIDGTLNTPEAARQIWFDNGLENDGGSGGGAEISLISPNIVVYSKNGGFLRASDDRGVTTSLKFPGTVVTNDAGVANNLNYVMPMALWESFNFTNSRDSVTYYAREAAVEAGQSVVVYSPNGKFPFSYIVPVAIPKGDSIRIQDVIQSRFISFFTEGPSDGLFMTKDLLQYTKDPEWFQIAKIADAVTCIAVSKDMNNLFAGTKTGKIYRVSNLALAYNYATADINSPTSIVAAELVKTVADGRAITSITISPEDNNWVVFTLADYGYNDYVYMTSNALDSVPNFINVQGNLPKYPVYSSLIEMHDKNKVIIGTDNGIYTSDNVQSGIWGHDNAGLGTVPIFMLRQQTTYQPKVYIDDNGQIFTYPGVQNYGAIYAATYGKGFFIDTTYYNPMGIDPGTVYPQASKSILVYPNPVKTEATVSYSLGSNSDVTLTIYDISGRTVKTINENNVSSGDHKIKIDMVSLPAGTYVIQLQSKAGNAYGKLMKVN